MESSFGGVGVVGLDLVLLDEATVEGLVVAGFEPEATATECFVTGEVFVGAEKKQKNLTQNGN